MKKQLSAAIIASSLLASCADHKRNEPVRHVKEGSGANAVTSSPAPSDVKALLTPLKPLLESDEPMKACERLEQLGKENREGKEAFSYLGWAGMNGETSVGHVELKESPFTQLVLGEKFAVDNFESFFEKARKEYEAGRLSATKWLILKTINATGIGREKALFSATNDKLAEKFPGIFGESLTLQSSLHFGLAQRAAGMPLKADAAVAKILSTKMPLFPGNRTWQDSAAASRATILAAARGFREATTAAPEHVAERLCATVLLNQSFAQLLRIKGLKAPVILDGEPGAPSRLEKLSSANKEFAKREVTGAVFDLKALKPVYLENEAIRKYDPAQPDQSLLTVSSAPPGDGKKSGPGTLGDSLAFMEAMLFAYEATSPASEQAERRYLLGDIAAEGSAAVLPAEMHSLALGLLTMQLKNVAGLHIKEIKANGSLKREKETAAGIVVTARPLPPGAGGSAEVHLADAVRLARVALFLESSLLRLGQKDPAQMKALNDAYSPEVLATLEGLRQKLATLKFPVVLLMSQMATSKEGCFSALEWNLDTGERKPLGQCSREEKLAAADAFELLGRDAKATLLLQKAQELRRQAQ